MVGDSLSYCENQKSRGLSSAHASTNLISNSLQNEASPNISKLGILFRGDDILSLAMIPLLLILSF
jgi:hypothetical protein